METTNPAGRLHIILRRAKEIARTNPESALQLWAATFDLAAVKRIDGLLGVQVHVISALLQLTQLIDETEANLKQIENLPDRYFRPFERIRAIPRQSLFSLNTNIAAYLEQLSEGDLTVLEFCSEKLESLHHEPVIDAAELETILEEITELFKEVTTANLNSDLKTFILDGLETMRRGINEFVIRGPQRLRESIAKIIGDYAINHPMPQTPEDEKSWEDFRRTVGRFIAVAGWAQTSMKFLQMFTSPLLPGMTN